MNTASQRVAGCEPEIPARLPLNQFSGLVAEELRAAMAVAEDCQAMVSVILDRAANEEATLRFQALDVLTQELFELSKIFGRLAVADDLGSTPDNLLDDVCLADLKARLAGKVVAAPASGDAEFW